MPNLSKNREFCKNRYNGCGPTAEGHVRWQSRRDRDAADGKTTPKKPPRTEHRETKKSTEGVRKMSENEMLSQRNNEGEQTFSSSI